MALPVSTDFLIGLGVIVVGFIAILAFVRATGGFRTRKEERDIETKQSSSPERLSIELNASQRAFKIPKVEPLTKGNEVKKARSTIRTLTLKQEILSMVMKRLFEAEDEGEITKEERLELSKSYEREMREVDEELKRAELLVSLNELEEIRSDIISQFEETLNETQQRIDLIINELDIRPQEEKEEPKPKPKRRIRRRRLPKPEEDEEEPEEEEGEEDEEEPEEEEGESRRRSRQDVEERLDRLKRDVLKELEELDRLELEA